MVCLLNLYRRLGAVLLILPCLENKQVDENIQPLGVDMKFKNRLSPFLAVYAVMGLHSPR
jgi:hypothetical protein